jgi:hypothetical protein
VFRRLMEFLQNKVVSFFERERRSQVACGRDNGHDAEEEREGQNGRKWPKE